MNQKLIGRIPEKKILANTLQSKDAILVAVYGRRRVGKTFLIREFYGDSIKFELTGMHNASLKHQLAEFTRSFKKTARLPPDTPPPSSWTEAFHMLGKFLLQKKKNNKCVIFIDEFPWLNDRKSGFLSAFEYFWNTTADRIENLVIVICGSAASWMIRNIINNKGGLHNRITQKIRLLPFTLKETELFLKSRKINLDHYQILQIYMALGGIPQYLRSIEKGDSATQTIEKACFSKDGILTGEFENLYSSLFTNSKVHVSIVKKLASAKQGLTRQQIISQLNLSSGGRTTQMLEELEESGFIKSAAPFDKEKKDSIYRLSDEYSLFYLKFIDKKKFSGKDTWIRLSKSNSYKAWSGMAFESICLKHVAELKDDLGIGGIETYESAWRYVPGNGKPGAQIDLLIDRSDKCINLCEIKFYGDEFMIDKAYASEIKRKLYVFQDKTKTRKSLFFTIISTFGVKKNSYSDTLVQKSLTMEALFN